MSLPNREFTKDRQVGASFQRRRDVSTLRSPSPSLDGARRPPQLSALPTFSNWSARSIRTAKIMITPRVPHLCFSRKRPCNVRTQRTAWPRGTSHSHDRRSLPATFCLPPDLKGGVSLSCGMPNVRARESVPARKKSLSAICLSVVATPLAHLASRTANSKQ